MRILILNWKDVRNPNMGGAEIILYELAKRFIKGGHQVTWFSRTFPGAIETETVDGIKIIRRGNKFTVYFEAWKYYLGLKEKPDKVIEGVNTLCWQIPLYVPREKRVTLVNQLMREVAFYELPFPIGFVAYFLESLEYQTYKRTNIVCYSSSVKEDLVRLGIPKKNIGTFKLGLDKDRYIPGVKSKTPLFVFVARLVKMKRADLCLEAFAMMVREVPNAKLAIVGYGPEEKNLSEMIKRLGIENKAFLVNKNNLFLKKKTNDVKVQLMQNAWALLLPSVKEGWGMVVSEAGACQTPAIVSDVTGLKDAVVADKTGLVVGKNPSKEELAAAMLTLIRNQKFLKKLSQGAKQYSNGMDWEKCYYQFKSLIS